MIAVALALFAVPPGERAAGATVPCSASDGPQFACWLAELPATR